MLARRGPLLVYIKTLFILGLFFGCTKKATMERGEHSARITDYESSVDRLDAIDWKVGMGLTAETVSKGFSARINLPVLKKEDIEFLYKKLEITAWLIRVKKISGPASGRSIGYMYASLVRKDYRSGEISPSSLKNATFRVLYHAAYPSGRFQRFRCPAFGHNLMIDELDLIKESTYRPTVRAYAASSVGAKVHKVEITQVPFSGGKSLRGEYAIEIALYNADKKIRMSDYVRIPEIIEIKKEKEKYLKECEDFKPTPTPSSKDKYKQFKFK